jgi:hypothetical protein
MLFPASFDFYFVPLPPLLLDDAPLVFPLPLLRLQRHLGLFYAHFLFQSQVGARNNRHCCRLARRLRRRVRRVGAPDAACREVEHGGGGGGSLCAGIARRRSQGA